MLLYLGSIREMRQLPNRAERSPAKKPHGIRRMRNQEDVGGAMEAARKALKGIVGASGALWARSSLFRSARICGSLLSAASTEVRIEARAASVGEQML